MSTSSTEQGCSVRPVIQAKPKTVSVNGVAIPRGAIARETQNHPAAKPIEAWQAAARALVIRELLLQEARRIGLEPAPRSDDEGRRETDEEALVRQLVAAEVSVPKAGEAECRRYFEQNRKKFVSPALFEVAHILLPAGPEDTVARAEARMQAELLILQLREAPSTFPMIAAAASSCPSGKNGGSLGQIGPGQTVPEFEAALAVLPVGQVAPEPVESRFGLHVVKVERCIPARELPFDLVRARIAAWLEEGVRRKAIRQYISILAGRADITGIELEASASPLVQ